jgi:dTDP-4-amino-4,6-dideoxygalactose transaminase
MSRRFRVPPAGEPVPLARLASLLTPGDAAIRLAGALAELVGLAGPVELHVSGRAALRAALVRLARETGRQEVVVPAYTCWSVPASVVAAGLQVRLVDVDAAGRIDLEDLKRQPLERSVAVVVCNLYGVPEPAAPVRALAAAAGAAVVDDAAQSLAACGGDGPVGGRGDVALLSFARGKPLSALGGGALVWRNAGDAAEIPPAPAPARWGALLRALAANAALSPRVFGWLAAVPALHVGATIYDPGFPQGGIDSASLALAAAGVEDVAFAGARRAARALALAERVAAESRFEPLVAAPGERGVYPRLALRAPNAGARARALEALASFGASASYPDALDRVTPLAPHLVERRACAGARSLAARILTLPTHAAAQRQAERMLRALGDAA